MTDLATELTDGLWKATREADRLRWKRCAEKADPGCTTCGGLGRTHGYITPGKWASYPCHCTGEADWQ